MIARTKMLLAGVAVTTALVLVFAWQQRRATREFKSLHAAAIQQRMQAEADARSLNPRLRAAETNPAGRPAAPPREKSSGGEAVSTGSPADAISSLKPRELLAKDPLVQVLWVASRRAQITASYGPLFQALGLAPDQIEKFQAVALRREEQAMDLAAVMQSHQLAGNDPAIAALRRQADAEEQAARRELLGSAGYGRLQDYLRTLPARDMVSGLAGAAALSGAPFSAAQAEELTNAVAGASLRYQAGSVADLTDVNWEEADRVARTLLSDAQFSLYQSTEPEGRGGRFSSRAASIIAIARKADAAR